MKETNMTIRRRLARWSSLLNNTEISETMFLLSKKVCGHGHCVYRESKTRVALHLCVVKILCVIINVY